MSMWEDRCPKCGREQRSTVFCKCLIKSQSEPDFGCTDCGGSGIHDHGTVECLDCGAKWKCKRRVARLGDDGKPTFYQVLHDPGTGGVRRVCKSCGRFFEPVAAEWICPDCVLPIGDALEQEECWNPQCGATFTPDPTREGQHLCPGCEEVDEDYYDTRNLIESPAIQGASL